MEEYLNKVLILSKAEQIHDFRGWIEKLPVFHFDKEWNVKIIPPFAGAVIRFTIDYKNKHVSVYFDGYSELGYVYDEEENQSHTLSITMGKIHIDIVLMKQTK